MNKKLVSEYLYKLTKAHGWTTFQKYGMEMST